MATGGMSPEEVRSTVSKLDESKPTSPAKAVMKGERLGEKSGAGGHVESEFRAPKSGKKD
jgi:hypothetical protein